MRCILAGSCWKRLGDDVTDHRVQQIRSWISVLIVWAMAFVALWVIGYAARLEPLARWIPGS